MTRKMTDEEMYKLAEAIRTGDAYKKDMETIDKIYARIDNEPEMNNRTLIRLSNKALKLEAKWANRDHGLI